MSQSCCPSESGSIARPPADPKWLRIGLSLVVLTILYNLVESVAAIYFGTEADSIALVGFGIDSLIEISAAALLLWRLIVQMRQRDEASVEKTEQTVHRFVGVTFYLLAAYIGVEALLTLSRQEAPEGSLPGIIIAVLSLLIMPALAWGKIRAAEHIGSAALKSEAKETIACGILSAILLVGLVANAMLGWWWADPAAGLMMIPWLLKEGTAGLKGEGCCG